MKSHVYILFILSKNIKVNLAYYTIKINGISKSYIVGIYIFVQYMSAWKNLHRDPLPGDVVLTQQSRQITIKANYQVTTILVYIFVSFNVLFFFK